VRVADVRARGTSAFASGFFRTLDQAAVRDESLHPGEAVNGMHVIEQHEGHDRPDLREGTQAAEGVGLVWLGCVHDRPFELGEQTVVVGDEPEVDCAVLVHRGIVKALGHAVTHDLVGDLVATLGPMVLGVGILDMGPELRAFARQVGPASPAVTGGTHRRRLDGGLRGHAAAREGGNRW
jgi:hypothetical protein